VDDAVAPARSMNRQPGMRVYGLPGSATDASTDTIVVDDSGQVVNDRGPSAMLTQQAWSLVTIQV
jgi:hypothetical protein